MRSKLAPLTLITGTMLILSSTSFAAPSPTKSRDESARATRLLNSVAADARQIETVASELDKLTKDSSATWKQYDRKWNEIQPVVEKMQIKIARLEAMESSLSPAEKQSMDQSKLALQKIAWHSAELGKLVDTVPADLNDPKFRAESWDLLKEAREIAKLDANPPAR